MGDARGGDADIAAAKAAHQPDVELLAKWGLTPEMGNAAAAIPAR